MNFIIRYGGKDEDTKIHVYMDVIVTHSSRPIAIVVGFSMSKHGYECYAGLFPKSISIILHFVLQS